MEKLIELMKRLLADVFTYGLKAQYFHWNVEGPDFKEYHNFFGEIYAAANEDHDTVAEHIRALDSYAPGSLKRFMELTNINDEDTIPAALEMFSRIYQDNQKIIAAARLAHAAAEEIGQYGVINFLEGLIDSYEKQAWMLRSTIKRV
jgi:starvation-inducible DNA-binding protein